MRHLPPQECDGRAKPYAPEERGEVTEKDLYSTILSVLQSHFDTEMSRSVSQAEFNDDAAVRISGNANRAMLAHQVGQDAVNDWLSAKLTPEFRVRWGRCGTG